MRAEHAPEPRHTLITGAGRGIGRLMAEALAAEGMAVGLVARSADELDESVALVEAAGGVGAAAVADVTDEWSVGPAIDRLRARSAPSTCSSTTPASSAPSAPRGRSTRASGGARWR